MQAVKDLLKTNWAGYITILLFIVVVVGTHLLSLTVFILFMYLFTDVFTNELHRRMPFIPREVFFWIFYGVLLAFMGFVIIRVIPVFIADFPRYYNLVLDDGTRFLQALSDGYGFHVNFEVVKDNLFSNKTKSFGYVMKLLNEVAKQVILFIFAVVLNLLVFLERGHISKVFTARSDTLLSYQYGFLNDRVGRFYMYFRKVMGGQVLISLINTLITTVIVIALGLPHKVTLICIVFACGMLPVVGNLISNSILCLTALVSSGVVALIVCLGLLVGIHKLEYFLNSKIIGNIVRLPMTVTLLTLLLGEATLGVFGMILAIPFVLTMRDEMAGINLKPGAGK